MNDNTDTKEFVQNLMKENNDILKRLIPNSTDAQVNAAITATLTDLGLPPSPAQEVPARRRYTDIQVRNEVANILNDLG